MTIEENSLSEPNFFAQIMAGLRNLSVCLVLAMLLRNSKAQEHTSSNLSPTDEGAPCGTVVIKPRPLIAYGQATDEGEFPWHAALYYNRNSNLSYICGGSLISRLHVLTAAHCVTRRQTNIPVRLENLVIYLGQYYFMDFSNSSVQEKKVTRIVPHPQYNAQNYANDIALVTFTAPAQITDYVRPICLWQESSNLTTVINKLGTVVGWSFDQTGVVTKELMQAKMPVASDGKCTLSFPDFFLRYLSSNSFCAGFQNGTTVCSGDSGSGLAFPKANSKPANPTWQLRGLVSISPPLQNQNSCNLLHYTIFTDVAAYLVWIRKTICSSGMECPTAATTEVSSMATKSQTVEYSTAFSNSLSSSTPHVTTEASSTTTTSQTVENKLSSSTPNPLEKDNLHRICGTVVPTPQPLIVYGQGTREGEFPWHVALFLVSEYKLTYYCGASLISKMHVLTAAHCVARRNTNTTIDPNNLVIFLGMSNLRRFYSPGIQQVDAADIILHPLYNARTHAKDIALIKFKMAAKITDYVRPVCVWQESQDLEAVINRQGNIAGWGYTENTTTLQDLAQANMVVASQVNCIYSYPDFFSRFTSSNTFCAGFRNGTSVCNGDAGGGLVFPISTSNPKNPRWQLRGIVSISVAQNDSKCDTSQYVIFTDAAKYIDWIKTSLTK